LIGHAVMRDSIDFPAVTEALKGVGLDAPDVQAQDRPIKIFAKAEAIRRMVSETKQYFHLNKSFAAF
jgi:hypothetical protein